MLITTFFSKPPLLASSYFLECSNVIMHISAISSWGVVVCVDKPINMIGYICGFVVDVLSATDNTEVFDGIGRRLQRRRPN